MSEVGPSILRLCPQIKIVMAVVATTQRGTPESAVDKRVQFRTRVGPKMNAVAAEAAPMAQQIAATVARASMVPASELSMRAAVVAGF